MSEEPWFPIMLLFSSTYKAPKHELGMSHLEESGQLLLTVRDFRIQLSYYKNSSGSHFVLSPNLQKKDIIHHLKHHKRAYRIILSLVSVPSLYKLCEAVRML